MKIINNEKLLKKVIFYIFIVAFMVFLLIPFVYTLFSSLMIPRDLSSIPMRFLPTEVTLDSYIKAFNQQPLIKFVFNSIIVAILVVLISVGTAALAAFGLTRTEIRYNKPIRFSEPLLLIFLLIAILPPITVINPIYQMFKNLGLLNSYLGLALAISAFSLPLAVWFLTAHFQSIPSSFDESAYIDGANIFQVFWHIILPCARTGIVTISILTFFTAWNNFLFASILNQKSYHKVATVALSLYQTGYELPFGTISAASIMTMLPLIIIVITLQKRIISNILDGGNKE